jgi:hypothetical protein
MTVRHFTTRPRDDTPEAITEALAGAQRFAADVGQQHARQLADVGQQLTRSVDAMAKAFRVQAQALAQLGQELSAKFSVPLVNNQPDWDKLQALTKLQALAHAAAKARNNPRQLRHVLHLLRQRRQAMADGIAAVVGDDLDHLLSLGAALLVALTTRSRCRHHRGPDVPHGRSALMAHHLVAHAPPARPESNDRTGNPGVT